MKLQNLSPLAIYNATRLQQEIQLDSCADITILFENTMPMSSLKLLIKFLFKNTKISSEYINNLFTKSSTDGKSTILLYFHEAVVQDVGLKDIFMNLIQKASETAQDAFLLFFGQVFMNNQTELN